MESITIKVENGGISKIIVSDNGHGIEKDDLPLSLSMHATSKISDVHDLLHLTTMGFRGEALYSIQTVSKLTLSSNTDEIGNQPGYKISNHQNKNNKIEAIAFKKGTRIEVKDLFYNNIFVIFARFVVNNLSVI